MRKRYYLCFHLMWESLSQLKISIINWLACHPCEGDWSDCHNGTRIVNPVPFLKAFLLRLGNNSFQ